jgi:hypothetical protein
MRTTNQLTKHEMTRYAKSCTTLNLFLLLPLLTACATDSSNDSSGTNFGVITLEAGESGTCISSPCKVYLEMPPGKGSYDVLADNMKVGSYPAGQTASLGSFWTGFTNFIIVGSDVGPTRLNVVGRR